MPSDSLNFNFFLHFPRVSDDRNGMVVPGIELAGVDETAVGFESDTRAPPPTSIHIQFFRVPQAL